MTNPKPHLNGALVNLDLGAVLDLRDQHAPPLLHLGQATLVIIRCHLSLGTHLLTFYSRKHNLFDDAGLLWLGQLDIDWLHHWHQRGLLVTLVSGDNVIIMSSLS